MAIFRRTPPRRPHPDPRIEAELRYILSLQAMVTDREDRIARYRKRARRLERGMPNDSLRGHGRQIVLDGVRADLARAEEEAEHLHAEIAGRMNALERDDLLWLTPG